MKILSDGKIPEWVMELGKGHLYMAGAQAQLEEDKKWMIEKIKGDIDTALILAINSVVNRETGNPDWYTSCEDAGLFIDQLSDQIIALGERE